MGMMDESEKAKNSCDVSQASPNKKLKRLCKYSKKWEAIHTWIGKESASYARCQLCKIVFSVSNKGYSAVRCHEASANHKSNTIKSSNGHAIRTSRRKVFTVKRALTSPAQPPKKIKRLCKYNTNWEDKHDWIEQEQDSIDYARCTFCDIAFSVASKGYSAVRCHEASARHKSKSVAQPQCRRRRSFTVKLSPTKPIKRLQKYTKNWEHKHTWIEEEPYSISHARCTFCDVAFLVGNEGYSAVKRHEASAHHQAAAFASPATTIETVSDDQSLPEKLLVMAVETTYVYHAIKHDHDSLDCSLKLVSRLHSDSKIFSKILCGKLKCETIVTKVLGPNELETIVRSVKSNNLFFSLQMQTSSKNLKLFPICVQYFTQERGLETKLIDVYESDESVDGMFATLSKTILELGLDFKKVSAFHSANSESTSSRNHSLFMKLKAKNDAILNANWYGHVIDNCFKVGLDELSVDVENIVLKIYGHFMSTERKFLKEFCKFVDDEFKEILSYVTTRWLSLVPCLERLLQNWNSINSHFFNLQKECPKQIQKIFNICESNEMIDDKVEIYLVFVHHMLQVFECTVKKLEQKNATCAELWITMSDFKSNLISRIENQFFGFEVQLKLEKLKSEERQKLKQEFISFYKVCLNFVTKRFDYNSNWLSPLASLAFANNSLPTYDDLCKIIKSLNLESILPLNMDSLRVELAAMKEKYDSAITNENWENNTTSEKWQYLLKSGSYTHMFRLISYAFSIPASSAFPESVLSVMRTMWHPERNRCKSDLLKNQLLVYVNSNASCTEFYDRIVKNTNLLNDKNGYMS